MLNNKLRKRNYMAEIKEIKAKIRWIEANDLYETHESQLQWFEARLVELGQKLAALD